MHNSAGLDRRTRQADLHVLYHDVVVHFGERSVCDVVGEVMEASG